MVLPTWQFCFNSPFVFGLAAMFKSGGDKQALMDIGDDVSMQMLILQALLIFSKCDKRWVRALVMLLDRCASGGLRDRDDIKLVMAKQFGNYSFGTFQSKARHLLMYMVAYNWYHLAPMRLEDATTIHTGLFAVPGRPTVDQKQQRLKLAAIDWSGLGLYIDRFMHYGMHELPVVLKCRFAGIENLVGGKFETLRGKSDLRKFWDHPEHWKPYDVPYGCGDVHDVHDWEVPEEVPDHLPLPPAASSSTSSISFHKRSVQGDAGEEVVQGKVAPAKESKLSQ